MLLQILKILFLLFLYSMLYRVSAKSKPSFIQSFHSLLSLANLCYNQVFLGLSTFSALYPSRVFFLLTFLDAFLLNLCTILVVFLYCFISYSIPFRFLCYSFQVFYLHSINFALGILLYYPIFIVQDDCVIRS